MHNKTEKILAAFLLRFSTFISENSRFIQKLLDLNVSKVTKLSFSKFFTDIRLATVFSTSFLIVSAHYNVVWVLTGLYVILKVYDV